MTIKSKRSIIAATYAQLLACYPVLNERKPLAIGVYDEVLAVVLDSNIVRSILSHHTSRRSYINQISIGGLRYHIDGTQSGQITDEHKDEALIRLAVKDEKILDIQDRQKSRKAELLAKKNAPKPVKVTKVSKQPKAKPINHSVMTMQTIAPIVKAATVVVKKRRFIPPV